MNLVQRTDVIKTQRPQAVARLIDGLSVSLQLPEWHQNRAANNMLVTHFSAIEPEPNNQVVLETNFLLLTNWGRDDDKRPGHWRQSWVMEAALSLGSHVPPSYFLFLPKCLVLNLGVWRFVQEFCQPPILPHPRQSSLIFYMYIFWGKKQGS